VSDGHAIARGRNARCFALLVASEGGKPDLLSVGIAQHKLHTQRLVAASRGLPFPPCRLHGGETREYKFPVT
jgi:hypothetical protein